MPDDGARTVRGGPISIRPERFYEDGARNDVATGWGRGVGRERAGRRGRKRKGTLPQNWAQLRLPRILLPRAAARGRPARPPGLPFAALRRGRLTRAPMGSRAGPIRGLRCVNQQDPGEYSDRRGSRPAHGSRRRATSPSIRPITSDSGPTRPQTAMHVHASAEYSDQAAERAEPRSQAVRIFAPRCAIRRMAHAGGGRRAHSGGIIGPPIP